MLPPAEFLDRFLICELKNEKLVASLRTSGSSVAVWLRDYETEFSKFVHGYPDIAEAIDQLREVHAQLWVLEDQVRKQPPLSEGEFAAVARRIFSLNTARHSLKARIDRIAGAFSFGERIHES